MKTETYKGTVESAYGNALATPVKFEGTYDAFESYAELETAKEIPTGDDIVSFVNARRKANARQKSMTEALDAAGIAKPDPNDPVVVRARMIKDLDKLDMSEGDKAALIAVLTAGK